MACSNVLLVLIACLLFFVWAQLPNCHYRGFVCDSTCQTLYYCDGANEKPVLLRNCNNTALCNSVDGECSVDEGLSCFAEHAFECKSVGFFPDLYDCTKFYNCSGSAPKFNKQQISCTKTAYDVRKKECDLPTTSSVCNRNGRIPGCTKAGDTGVVDGDNNLYYVCIRNSTFLYIYPELHKCSGHGTYDPNTFTCS